MKAHTEVIDSTVQNPGALRAFEESGGTKEEWHDQLDAFHVQQVAKGVTDTQLLNQGELVTIQQIDKGE